MSTAGTGMEKGKEGKEDVLRSQFLDAESGKPLSHIDRLLKRFPFNDPSDEATSKGVAIRSSVTSVIATDLNKSMKSTYPAPLVS